MLALLRPRVSNSWFGELCVLDRDECDDRNLLWLEYWHKLAVPIWDNLQLRSRTTVFGQSSFHNILSSALRYSKAKANVV